MLHASHFCHPRSHCNRQGNVFPYQRHQCEAWLLCLLTRRLHASDRTGWGFLECKYILPVLWLIPGYIPPSYGLLRSVVMNNIQDNTSVKICQGYFLIFFKNFSLKNFKLYEFARVEGEKDNKRAATELIEKYGYYKKLLRCSFSGFELREKLCNF